MANCSPPIPASAHRVLILARSYRHGGWCVAGKFADGPQRGNWLRPTGADPQAGLTTARIMLRHAGRLAAPLDLTNLSLGAHRPYLHQSENFIDAGGWQLAGRAKIEDALEWIDQPRTLWGGDSFAANDRLSADEALRQPGSLLLVRVRGFSLINRVSPWGKKLRGIFSLNFMESQDFS